MAPNEISTAYALNFEIVFLNHLFIDSFGWNPLHYACAFSADDEDLIRFLVEQEPRCIFQADIYGRYPLHIACDNEKVQSSVVELLLGSEEKLILKTTKYFKVRRRIYRNRAYYIIVSSFS